MSTSQLPAKVSMVLALHLREMREHPLREEKRYVRAGLWSGYHRWTWVSRTAMSKQTAYKLMGLSHLVRRQGRTDVYVLTALGQRIFITKSGKIEVLESSEAVDARYALEKRRDHERRIASMKWPMHFLHPASNRILEVNHYDDISPVLGGRLTNGEPTLQLPHDSRPGSEDARALLAALGL